MIEKVSRLFFTFLKNYFINSENKRYLKVAKATFGIQNKTLHLLFSFLYYSDLLFIISSVHLA